MARGIRQTDVWSAADALLREGVRPTIERVRQRIGRGSPNTVAPHLEAWHRKLGGRIAAEQDAGAATPGELTAPVGPAARASMTVPVTPLPSLDAGLPAPVLQAARLLWETAQAQTRYEAEARLREGMAAAVANVEAEKERAAVAHAAAFEAAARSTRAQAELADCRDLLEQERMAHAATKARLADALAHVEQLSAAARGAQADVWRAELAAALVPIMAAAGAPVAAAPTANAGPQAPAATPRSGAPAKTSASPTRAARRRR